MISKLLTFDYEGHCRLARRFEAVGTGAVTLGEEEALNLLFLEEGRCTALNMEAVLLAAGSVVVSPRPVTFSPVGPFHLLGVALQGGAAEEILSGLAGPLHFHIGQGDAGAGPVLRRLADPAVTDPAQQSALGFELLCRLTRLSDEGEALPPLPTAVIELIRAHYGEVYGVEELAAELGVSKGHLIRSFKAATGLSPGRYLTAVRLEAAKALLLHRDYPLEVVAGLCGFSGANYLCRVFRREEGLTPSAWRQANAAGSGPPLSAAPPDLEESLYL